MERKKYKVKWSIGSWKFFKDNFYDQMLHFHSFLTLCIWNFLKYMFIAKELKFIKSNTHYTVSLTQQCFGIVVVSNADITFEWKYCGDFVTLNSYLLVFCRRLIFQMH